tara:strand:+ start:1570 stop:2556 length:987 start_codon:yes stop_codon:yes gene_type:complete
MKSKALPALATKYLRLLEEMKKIEEEYEQGFLTDSERHKARVEIQTKINAVMKMAKFFMEGIDPDQSPRKIKDLIGVSYMGDTTNSVKTAKGEAFGVMTYIVYLLSGKMSGIQMCKFASPGCLAACLNISGQALIGFHSVGLSNHCLIPRLIRTWLVAWNRPVAEKIIEHEMLLAKKRAVKADMKFAVRLNGTSDLWWGSLIKRHPDLTFYDYTKSPFNMRLSDKFDNYHITFSYAGPNNVKHCAEALARGHNIAIPVVKGDIDRLLESKRGYTLDDSDARFLDSDEIRLGLLTVKHTPGTREGIEAGFLLDGEGFNKLEQALGLAAA